ncbi:MAG TPA: 16S rRNA (adenine(1518)-N(6)/adenine(1519)-N(6))-dimethyltransferase RsmA [Candidatus Saccharimonas sp.]|nr:16S rRNA (adenine(1518)-N(6)/adenine(1519)-N(6))-dimethyltransferase RsmA [Candidatus Saccharimonas sp.]
MPTPKKSLGQHWLFDSKSLGAICDAAGLEPSDTVLEIGPGLGPLTVELTARAKQVIAIELDERLARELPARIPAANLSVVHADFLHYDLSQLPTDYKVVANVPYYVTSLIIRALLESKTPPSRAVLLVQKEVAQRLAAKPGDMSILAISAQFYAEVSLGMVVTADKFDPPPKVDSQVVIFDLRTKPLFADIEPKQFFRIVKAGFSEKRKTLRNSLSGGLGITKDQSEIILKDAGIDPGVRAETLSLEQWHNLVLTTR